jgi:transposase InsO family protein
MLSTPSTRPVPRAVLQSSSAATTGLSSSPWRSRTGAASAASAPPTSSPAAPWETPFVESFNGKARDELFAREIFDSLFEARVLWDDYCLVYHHERPHSSLGYLPPAVFAAALRNPEPS